MLKGIGSSFKTVNVPHPPESAETETTISSPIREVDHTQDKDVHKVSMAHRTTFEVNQDPLKALTSSSSVRGQSHDGVEKKEELTGHHAESKTMIAMTTTKKATAAEWCSLHPKTTTMTRTKR